MRTNARYPESQTRGPDVGRIPDHIDVPRECDDLSGWLEARERRRAIAERHVTHTERVPPRVRIDLDGTTGPGKTHARVYVVPPDDATGDPGITSSMSTKALILVAGVAAVGVIAFVAAVLAVAR